MANYQVDEYGRVVLDSEGVFELWFQGGKLEGACIAQDEEIISFNKQCNLHDKNDFSLADGGGEPEPHAVRTKRWLIPPKYLELDVEAYCLSLCATDDERARVRHEMQLFGFYDMLPVLQTLVYMIDVFREQKIVWGIGRGSSVASYVLYLIGVHKIDSIRFGLDIEDFLR